MICYDPRGMTWNQYCALMCELFASNQLGTMDESNWRDWVNNLVNIGIFSKSSMPDQRTYNNWQDWAQAMVGAVSITEKRK